MSSCQARVRSCIDFLLNQSNLNTTGCERGAAGQCAKELSSLSVQVSLEEAALQQLRTQHPAMDPTQDSFMGLDRLSCLTCERLMVVVDRYLYRCPDLVQNLTDWGHWALTFVPIRCSVRVHVFNALDINHARYRDSRLPPGPRSWHQIVTADINPTRMSCRRTTSSTIGCHKLSSDVGIRYNHFPISGNFDGQESSDDGVVQNSPLDP